MRALLRGRVSSIVAVGLIVFCLVPRGGYSQTIRPQQTIKPIAPLPLSPENEYWLDLEIYQGLRTVINAGADLYNQEFDRAACYRVYQGSLLSLRPLLGHHPDLQKAIDNGLADAASRPSIAARAFALRAVLDEIRAKLKPASVAHTKEPPRAPEAKLPAPSPSRETTTPSKNVASKRESLWARLGGEAGVAKIVDDWVALAAADPRVNFSRGDKSKPSAARIAELKRLLVGYLSEQSSGPIKYAGKSMKEAHQKMLITQAEFDAFIEDLRKALEKYHVGSAEAKEVLGKVEATKKEIVQPK